MRGVTNVDVLVVGLGPAGGAAAAQAALQGASVLAIDRKAEPGLPVQCAEFVPRMVGVEVDHLNRAKRQPITSMMTYLDDGRAHAADAADAVHVEPNFPGLMIDRAKFDRDLAARAKAAGADCRFGIIVRGFAQSGAATLSDGTVVAPRVVIGADGPRSVVARAVGEQTSEIVETRQIRVRLSQPHDATDVFLSVGIPGGYAWLFPSGDQANLGIGVAPGWRRLLKPLLEGLHKRLIWEGRVGAEVLGCTGGAIPVGGLRRLATRLGQAVVLLAGDAAGMANPVTGAGISSAVISGREAGQAAARIVAGEPDAGEAYAEEMTELFGPSLARALARRQALMAIYQGGRQPDDLDLKRSWIAFPDYWAA